MVHVPYKGTAPALTALLSGDIQVLVDVPITMMPQVRAGKVRALGLFSAKRIPGASEVPTLVEAGGPAIEGSTWVMFLAPAGTPRDALARLSAETAKVIASPEIRTRFDQMGVEPVGSTPEQAARFLEDEIVKWGRVITAANVKPEL
jgi:tripartite-type tricarboxylate transporter receptor subunit TctC